VGEGGKEEVDGATEDERCRDHCDEADDDGNASDDELMLSIIMLLLLTRIRMY
jgi:hypothetical protein